MNVDVDELTIKCGMSPPRFPSSCRTPVKNKRFKQHSVARTVPQVINLRQSYLICVCLWGFTTKECWKVLQMHIVFEWDETRSVPPFSDHGDQFSLTFEWIWIWHVNFLDITSLFPVRAPSRNYCVWKAQWEIKHYATLSLRKIQ